MNSAPHLLKEDRPEFERILDDTLRAAPGHPALAGIGRRLGRAQLRSMAMNAAMPIAACADTEYQHFVALRAELRHPRHAPSSARSTGADDGHGAGLVAVVSVLAPLLAGTAALIFLLVGYGLHLLSPEPALAAPMRGAGWTFAVLAAGTALLGMGGVLLTALRNGPTAVATPGKVRRRRTAGGRAGGGGAGEAGSGDLADAVAGARDAWRKALLDRGILPFLSEALADPAGAERSPEALARELPDRPGPPGRSGSPDRTRQPDLPPPRRTTRLGYSHPGFSSPAATGGRRDGAGEPATPPARPRYSSPEYTSPGYAGPEYEGPTHGGPAYPGPAAYGGPEAQPE